MARQKKAGLSYFPLDTAFFEDKRIRRLASRFGSDGPLFYLYILCKAYQNSYFTEYNDDFVEDVALDLNCSTEKIGLMLHYLLDKSLLDNKLFSTVKVLSSHGIQTQYQESKKGLKRDIEVDGDSWILNKSETEGFVKVRDSENKSEKNEYKSGINSDKSGIYPQSKVKESKLNEMKENEKKEDSGRPSDPDAAELSKVMSHYQDTIDPTPTTACTQEIITFIGRFGADIVLHAIDRARDNLKAQANWAYIRGILRGYTRDKVKTLDDVLRLEQAFDAGRGRQIAQRGKGYHPPPMTEESPETMRKDIENMRKMYEHMKGGAP